MRGEDKQQHGLFRYGSLEDRVPQDHPLRPIRGMAGEALKALSPKLDEICGRTRRTNPRRTRRHGSIGRATRRKPDWCIWGTCGRRTGTD
jgi:hypothetical protein